MSTVYEANLSALIHALEAPDTTHRELRDPVRRIFLCSVKMKGSMPPLPSLEYCNRVMDLRGRVKKVSEDLGGELARICARQCMRFFPNHRHKDEAKTFAIRFLSKFPEFRQVHALYNFLNHSNIRWRIRLCDQLLGDEIEANHELVNEFFNAMQTHTYICEKYMAVFKMDEPSQYIRCLPSLATIIHENKEEWVERAQAHVMHLKNKDRLFFLQGLRYVQSVTDVRSYLLFCETFIQKYDHFGGEFALGTGRFYKELMRFESPKESMLVIKALEKVMETRPDTSIVSLSLLLRAYRKALQKSDRRTDLAGVLKLLELIQQEPFLRRSVRELEFLASKCSVVPASNMLQVLTDVPLLRDEVRAEITCCYEPISLID
jgi:hypothetical protein